MKKFKNKKTIFLKKIHIKWGGATRKENAPEKLVSFGWRGSLDDSAISYQLGVI